MTKALVVALLLAVAGGCRPQPARNWKTVFTLQLDVPKDFTGDRTETADHIVSMLQERLKTVKDVHSECTQGPQWTIVVHVDTDKSDALDRVRRLVSSRGALAIREVAEPEIMKRFNEDGKVPAGWIVVSAKDHESEARHIKDKLLVKADPIITETDFADAYPGPITIRGAVGTGVHFQLTLAGGKRFDAAAMRLFKGDDSAENGQLAILLDDEIMSMPTVNTAHFGGAGTISGTFTQDSAQILSTILKARRLPVPLKLLAERPVEPGK